MQTLESSPKTVAGNAPFLQDPSLVLWRGYRDDPRWLLAQRIAASTSLGRSRLMADFLLYVVDRHIRNRGDEITEQQIGVLVFGRPEGYDSNEDNIVRSYARNLRKRIDEYFTTEGKEETLLLKIPRGGYTPIFSERIPAPELASSTPVSVAPEAPFRDAPIEPDVVDIAPDQSEQEPLAPVSRLSKTTAALRKHGTIVALCIGLLLGATVALLFPFKLARRASASSVEAASINLWRQLFTNTRDTFVVPSDDGLIIMQSLVDRPVPLAQYMDGSYRTNPRTDGVPGAAEIRKLGARRYTSVVDLDFVSRIAQLEEVVPERMMVRYARDLRMDDLRSGNAILIGSIEANPWIELFQPQLNFRYSINPANDKPSGIANLHPRAGESTIYGTPGKDHTYGLIAYVPNLNSTGHVLIVGGLNTAGTQAATTFLLTPALMAPTLQRARTEHGTLKPFELVIGAGSVAANASTPQVIAERIGPS